MTETDLIVTAGGILLIAALWYYFFGPKQARPGSGHRRHPGKQLSPPEFDGRDPAAFAWRSMNIL